MENEYDEEAEAEAEQQRAAALGNKPVKKKIAFAIQKLFAELQMLEKGVTDTLGLTKAFGWEGREGAMQHDVQELNRFVVDRALPSRFCSFSFCLSRADIHTHTLFFQFLSLFLSHLSLDGGFYPLLFL